MAYNNEYPYFDPCNVNMDWLLAQMKELRETVLGLENVKFLGENPETDWNKLEMQSIAVYTAGNASINGPTTSPEGLVYTNGDKEYSAYQIFFANNGDRWFRHYETSWSAWENMNDLNIYYKQEGVASYNNFDNFPSHTFIYVDGDLTNAPNRNPGTCITMGLSIIQQIYIERDNPAIWNRRNLNGSWSTWKAIPNLSSYVKNVGRVTSLTSIDNAENNSIYFVYNVSGFTPGTYGFLQTFIDNNAQSNKQQFYYDRISGNIFQRIYQSEQWNEWRQITFASATMRLIRENPLNCNEAENCTIKVGNASTTTGGPNNNFGFVETFGFGVTSDTRYQRFTNFFNGSMYFRYSQGSTYTNWVQLISETSPTTVAVASNISDPNATAPLALTDESTEVEIPEEIMTPPSTMFDDLNPSKWLRCPGQGLFAHDEDAQSFADAILLEDLSDIEYIVTNFEMYDMSLPLEEITTHVTVLADAIKNTYPLTELVIMGIPPIDVPFWGSEFFDYPMPNEITIRELDAKMEELALQYGFRYITWQDFDPIKIENLLDDHPDILQSSLYFKKLKGFVKSSVN